MTLKFVYTNICKHALHFFSEFSAIDRYLEASHFTTDPKMDFHLDQKVLTFKLEYRLREFAPVSLISLQL